MARESVLIISLGLSPAVVTETIDALLDKGINLKRIYIVTSSNESILNKCIPLLKDEFDNNPQYRGRELRPYDALIQPHTDIIDEMDNTQFMSLVARLMKREQDSDVFLGIAGGRKTMAAGMATLGQIFGARAIVHVLVSPEIEEKGRIDRLAELSAEQRQYALHPAERRLILFPVIGTTWMLEEMVDALKGQVMEDTKTLGILRLNGLLDSNGKPTSLGSELLKIIEDIESFPPPSFKMPEDKIRLPSREPNMPKQTLEFVRKLSRNPWVTEIRSREYVNSNETRIVAVESDGTIVCQYSDGSKAVKFFVSTTAKTKGQAERVRNSLREFQ